MYSAFQFLGLTHTRERSNCQVSSKWGEVSTHLDWFALLGCRLLGFSSCFMVNGMGLCFLLNYEPLKVVTSLSFHDISPPSALHLPPSPSTPLYLAQCPPMAASKCWVDVKNPYHLNEAFAGNDRGSTIQEKTLLEWIWPFSLGNRARSSLYPYKPKIIEGQVETWPWPGGSSLTKELVKLTPWLDQTFQLNGTGG